MTYQTTSNEPLPQFPKSSNKSDGSSSADYYKLPPKAKELQDLISYKNMNGQVAESFRSLYMYGDV